jgi:hypothetical protein
LLAVRFTLSPAHIVAAPAVTIGAWGNAVTEIAIVEKPEQPVPEVHVPVYNVFAAGLTLKVRPVRNTVVLTPWVQVIVPVQFAAVKVVESPKQTAVLFAEIAGVWPSPPTVIVLVAMPEQVPTVQVTE